MIIIDNIDQGSPQWLSLRAGIPGASSFSEILTAKTLKPSASRIKLLYQLAGERIIKSKPETYSSYYMKRGTELEPQARDVFSMLQEVDVDQVGYCYYDERKDRGCSPDGLIGEVSGLELKCPSLSVHVAYLMKKELPSDYFQQVQGSLYITGYEYWFFMSYHPGIKPLIIKVYRDEKFISLLHSELESFCSELDELTEKLKAL